MRHNFSDLTKLELALSAHFRCVRPGCNQLTHVYNKVSKKMVHIGSASHDVAAGRLGPRADSSISPEQIKSYENGAWLCRNCATFVDVLWQQFPIGTLPRWQNDAVLMIAEKVSSPISPLYISYVDACQRAKKFIDLFKGIDFRYYDNITLPRESLSKIETILTECAYLSPLNGFCTLYHHTTNVQRRIIDNLRQLINHIRYDNDVWFRDDYHYFTVRKNYYNSATHQKIDYLTGIDKALINDIWESTNYLTDFYNGNGRKRVLDMW